MEDWRGVLIGRMHNYKVTQIDLANKLGLRRDYVSSVLNGKRNPPGAEERYNKAFVEILNERM